MKKNTIEIIKKLNIEDFEILKYIYNFRCLTFNQIKRTFYENMSDSEFERDVIDFLIELKVIELVEFDIRGKAYFLTSIGIDIVKYLLDLPNNVFDNKRKVVKRGYYTAGELKMLPRLINHQSYLNQFVLDFEKRGLFFLKDYFSKFNKIYNQTELKKIFQNKFKYFDEKFLSQYTNIRPDGMINFMDTHFFLEMDMSTESKKQLVQKWDNYRKFLITNEFKYGEQKIVVFFILENTKNLQKRKDLIYFTLNSSLIDKVSSKFELFIGTKNELLDLAFNKLVPNLISQSNANSDTIQCLHKHDFLIKKGIHLNSIFPNKLNYLFYLKHKTNKLEFLFDDFTNNPLTVISKIAFHDKNSSFYFNTFKRDIKYLILAKSEYDIKHILSLLDLLFVKNIYFTTLDRLLNNSNFAEAIFTVDTFNNIYHFEDLSLTSRIFEKTIIIKN